MKKEVFVNVESRNFFKMIWIILAIEVCFLILPRLALDFISLQKRMSNFSLHWPHLLTILTAVLEILALYALIWLTINCVNKTLTQIPKLVKVGLFSNFIMIVVGPLFLWSSYTNWPDTYYGWLSTIVIGITTLAIMNWRPPETHQTSSQPLLIKNLGMDIFMIVTFAFILYWYVVAPVPGFCVAQNRFISDAEYIKFATEKYNLNERKFDGKNYSLLKCCGVQKIEGNFISKILRADEGVWVTWSFEMNSKAINRYSSNPDDKYYQVVNVVDTCATKFLDEYGIAEKNP